MPLLTLIVLGLSAAAFLAALFLLIRGALYRSQRPLSLLVTRRRDAAGDLFTLILQRPIPARLLPLPRYAAGQSVQLAIPGETVKRRYSIARWKRLPFAYELTIKREPHGRFSARLADHAQAGARLLAGRPSGSFILPRRAAAPRAVFIAGGVGITPLLAMLDQWAAVRGPYAEAYLYWQIRQENEAIYRDALASLARRCPALRVRILVSRPAQGRAEKISAELLCNELGRLEGTDFYLCAGSGLLDSMLTGLGDAGVAEQCLHFERFTLGAPGEGGNWMVAFGGKRFSFAGHASLLDAIEAEHLAIDADCRTGSCGRCLLKIDDGEARHRVTPEYEAPPGTVLACCAVPASDLRVHAAAIQ